MTDNFTSNTERDFLPLPEDAPEWAVALNSNVGILAVAVSNIETTHAKILATVDELKPEVMSFVNSLETNPMVKMFLGGKKS